jgi:hypothetical protein
MIVMQRNPALAGTAYEPTLEAIQGACQKIQATWSRRERVKRIAGPHGARWIPPTVRLSDLLEAYSEDRSDGPPYFGAAGNGAER